MGGQSHHDRACYYPISAVSRVIRLMALAPYWGSWRLYSLTRSVYAILAHIPGLIPARRLCSPPSPPSSFDPVGSSPWLSSYGGLSPAPCARSLLPEVPYSVSSAVGGAPRSTRPSACPVPVLYPNSIIPCLDICCQPLAMLQFCYERERIRARTREALNVAQAMKPPAPQAVHGRR